MTGADSYHPSSSSSEDNPPAKPPPPNNKAKDANKGELLEKLQAYLEENGVEWVSGWRVEVKQRTGGSSAGTCDIYYYSPAGKRFRSKAEIAREHGIEVAKPARGKGKAKRIVLLSHEAALEKARQRAAKANLPIKLKNGVNITSLGTLKPLHTTETELVFIGFTSQWTDAAGITFVSSVVDAGSGPYYIVKASSGDKGDEVEVGAGLSADAAWQAVAERQAEVVELAAMHRKNENQQEQLHGEGMEPAEAMLLRANPLQQPWGLERYGLSDVSVLQVLEGQSGIERSPYKFVEERTGWDEESQRLLMEAVRHGKAPPPRAPRPRPERGPPRSKEERETAVVHKVMDNMLRQLEVQEARAAARKEREVQRMLEKEQKKLVKEKEREMAKKQAEREREALRLASVTEPDETLPGAQEDPPLPAHVGEGKLPMHMEPILLEAWQLAHRFADVLGLDRADLPTLGMLEDSLVTGSEPAATLITSLTNYLASDLFSRSAGIIAGLGGDVKETDLRPAGRTGHMHSIPLGPDTWPEVTRRYLASAASAAAVWEREGKTGLPFPLDALDHFVCLQYLTAGPPRTPASGPVALPDGAAPHAWVAMLARSDAEALAQALGGDPDASTLRAQRCVLRQLTQIKGDKGHHAYVLCFNGQSAAAAVKYGRPLDLRCVAARVEAGVYARMPNPMAAFAADVEYVCALHISAIQKSSSAFASEYMDAGIIDVSSLVHMKLEAEVKQLQQEGVETYLEKRAAEDGVENVAEYCAKPFYPEWFSICSVCWDEEDQERMVTCASTSQNFHIYCLDPPLEEKPPAGVDWVFAGGQQQSLPEPRHELPTNAKVLWQMAQLLGEQEWAEWEPAQRATLLSTLCSLTVGSPALREYLAGLDNQQKDLRKELQGKKHEVKQHMQPEDAKGPGNAADSQQKQHQQQNYQEPRPSYPSVRGRRDPTAEHEALAKEISALEYELQSFEPQRLSLLGTDRHYNRYYYLRPEALGPPETTAGAVVVERYTVEPLQGVVPPRPQDQWQIGLYRGFKAVEGFMRWLNTKGTRERALHNELKRVRLDLQSQEDIIEDRQKNATQRPPSVGPSAVAEPSTSTGAPQIQPKGSDEAGPANRLRMALLDFESGLQPGARDPIRGTFEQMEVWKERVSKAATPQELMAALLCLEQSIAASYLKTHWRPWAMPAPYPSDVGAFSGVWLRFEALKSSVKMTVRLNVAMKDISSLIAKAREGGLKRRAAAQPTNSGTSSGAATGSKRSRHAGVDTDEELARKLDAELNAGVRGRPHRSSRLRQAGNAREDRGRYKAGVLREAARPSYMEESGSEYEEEMEWEPESDNDENGNLGDDAISEDSGQEQPEADTKAEKVEERNDQVKPVADGDEQRMVDGGDKGTTAGHGHQNGSDNGS